MYVLCVCVVCVRARACPIFHDTCIMNMWKLQLCGCDSNMVMVVMFTVSLRTNEIKY